MRCLGILDEVYDVVLERIRERPRDSYTAFLAGKGLGYASRKLGEEAVETIVAALSEGEERLAEEAADLLYHLLVVLALRGVDTGKVCRVLEGRRSG